MLEQGQQAVFVEHRLLHGLIGSLLVIDEAFEHKVAQHGHSRAAHHAVGLTSQQVPNGELALLAKDVDKGVGNVIQLVGVNEGHERVLCAIGVPQRERAVVGRCSVMHAGIGTAIVAVDITEYRWSYHAVIHGSVEDAHHRGVGRGGLDPSQLHVPLGIGLCSHLVEIPSRHLGTGVVAGVVAAHAREAHFHNQGLRGVVELDDGDALLGLAHNSDGL